MNKQVLVFGYNTGIGGIHSAGCSRGPRTLQHSSYLTVPCQVMPVGDNLSVQGPAAIPFIQTYCTELATLTQKAVIQKQPFVTWGGDHTCAIGTWSGAASAGLTMGLIWIDAHLDSHTPQTSHSGNTHGMPLATLLGFGDPRLTEILTPEAKIDPSNLCIIGVRSYEPEEEALHKKLGVKIYNMKEIKERGLETVLAEAIQHVTANSTGFGFSIDLDAIDPKDAPGVGVPEPDGIRAAELISALKSYHNHPQLVGAEIVEFNPDFDHERRTEKVACQLMASLFTAGE